MMSVAAFVAGAIAAAPYQARPSDEEQARMVEKAREVALQYTAGLPNFICTETFHRAQRGKGAAPWKDRDTLTVSVALSEKGEQYKLVAIDGKPTTKKLNSVGGFKSSGEFGTLLSKIFEAESKTEFRWVRWAEVGGRPMHVFSYRIAQANSKYGLHINVFLKSYRMIAGMRGEIFVDRETGQAMRFSYEAEGLPADWPILGTPAAIDYGFAEIAGQRYLLPLRVEAHVVMKNRESRNVIEFANYRRFSSEATVSFEK